MNAVWAILSRDLTLALRAGGRVLQGLVFFALVTSLFALALGGDTSTLAPLAPALIWTAFVLALMISFDRIFNDDFVDTTLQTLRLTGVPMGQYVIAKAISYTLITLLPLLIVTPLAGLVLGLDMPMTAKVVLTLCLGAPALIGYGVFSAACFVGLRQVGYVIALIGLPLILPVVTFAVDAIDSTSAAGITAPEILALIGISAIVFPLGLVGAAAALNAHLET